MVPLPVPLEIASAVDDEGPHRDVLRVGQDGIFLQKIIDF